MALKSEKLEYLYTYCNDPRKDRVDFPCGWLDGEGKCRWKGEKKCQPVKLDWFYTSNMDSLKEIEL